jgi:hypothetical protein
VIFQAHQNGDDQGRSGEATARPDRVAPTFTWAPFLNSAAIFSSLEATPSDAHGNWAFGLGLHHDLPGAAPVRDLVFLPQQGNAPPASVLSKAAYGGAGGGTTADGQGDRDADHDADGARSEGEADLSGRAGRLVDEQGAVVAETRTGAEGANRFVGAPAGRYRVEAVACPEWAGTVSPTSTEGTEPVKSAPLTPRPAGDGAEEGALPAEAGVASEEGPATPVSTAVKTFWALLGAALPIFHSRKARRKAAAAPRHRAC